MNDSSTHPPPPSWCRLLVAPVVVGLVAMAWLSWSGLDLKFQSMAFDFDLRRWTYGEDDLWLWLFQYGPLPMLAMGFTALFTLLAGFAFPKLARFMKPALFLILTIVISSGLITNVILKDTWGRPRPSQVEGFGLMTDVPGLPYRPPFSPAFGQDGKSFPCGHATTGFGLAAIGFVLLRRRPRLATAVFAATYGYGVLIGIARMTQGGHFATDVIASALICHVTQSVLYRVMRLHEHPEWAYRPGRSRWGMAAGIGVPVMGAAAFGAMLATPYRDAVQIAPETLAKNDRDATAMKIETFGNVHIDLGEATQCHGTTKGFGLPKSRVKYALQTRGSVTRFFQIERGWFTELSQELVVTVPAKPGMTVDLSAPERAAIWDIDLTRATAGLNQSWVLHDGPGTHPVIHVNEDSPVVIQRASALTPNPVMLFQGPGAGAIHVTVNGPVDPEVRVRPREVASTP
ncbi:phosphatase PAP2 family protein [Luteolibacter sp. LG18]|uniref:phosphatase PAP2 family protein n=1 Tax=Luteolibacter sp. LG18 TaxID=2819286 RepID=UPI002B2B7713|nr:hypothetical protein llg_04180 [Luteolibacter sp. LG18]